ncbi:MAG: c-type cytochrome [Acidobacteria bacterium]|nr:c-type cytochrome [Acidobacteriota bacterium]
MRCLGTLLAAAGLAAAQTVYEVERARTPIVIDGKLDEPAWRSAPPAGDFHFTWWKEGDKEQTVAKMLWDDDNLYVGFHCRDKHISAYVTQRHGPVSNDDCVEIFLSPDPEKAANYYTFEINAIGTMLNRCKTDWWKGPPTWEPEGVRYRTSFHGWAKKDESKDDDHWEVELAIPFKNFERDAANTPPREGDQWRLNLNRTGGITNRQSSSWSPIPAPRPQFHTPSAFGWVRFVDPHGKEEGRAIYNRSCTGCHGLDGAAGDRGPALGATRKYLRSSEEDLYEAIRNGIAGTLMPAMALADADIKKIVAYIRGLRATAVKEHVPGDRAAGEALFWGKGECGKCHTLGGRGGLLGPDLSSLGAERRLAAIREALTQPLPHVPRGYQPVRLTTSEGRAIRGIVKNENNFSLQVLDESGKLHLLLREEVSEIQYSPEALMPRDYQRRLTPDEFQNLLAFLSKQARGRTR